MKEILITAIVVPLVGLVVWMVKQFITTLEKVQKRSEEKDDKFLTTIDNFSNGLGNDIKEGTRRMGVEHVELKEGQELIVTTVTKGFEELKKKINK